MRILQTIVLIIPFFCNAQMPGLVGAVGQQRTGRLEPPSIDSVSVSGILPATTKTPKTNIVRTNETVTLTATAYYNGDALSSGVSFAWSIQDASDGSEDLTGSGSALDCSSLPIGEYHVEVTATGANTFPYFAVFGLIVEGPNITSPDLTINLSQVQSATWSNPLGNLDATDQGTNAVMDFQEVSRPGFTIILTGNFTGVEFEITGLKGTLADPVIIQNQSGAQVVFTETSTGNILKFSDNCQYITLDGARDPNEYGFKFNGRTTTGTQSQLLYAIGEFISGIKILGCYFDQKMGEGASDGGACVQFAGTKSDGTVSDACNGTIGDPGYFENAYFTLINNKFEDTWDEDVYMVHRDEELLPTKMAYRLDMFKALYNRSNNSGRDWYQWALTNDAYVMCNYGNNNALEENSDHTSATSFNDGNRGIHYIGKNYFENVEIFTSIQNGSTGDGTYYFFDNFVKQKATVATNPNQFVFYNIENAIASNAFFFNNTLVAPDVNFNPWAVQHDAPTTFPDLTLQIKGNVTSSGGSDDSPYAFVRDIGLPSAPNRAAWVIDNTERRTADQSQLKLNGFYEPNDVTSPAYGSGFDLTSFDLPGGLYDINGFSKYQNGGWISGCFANPKMFIP